MELDLDFEQLLFIAVHSKVQRVFLRPEQDAEFEGNLDLKFHSRNKDIKRYADFLIGSDMTNKSFNFRYQGHYITGVYIPKVGITLNINYVKVAEPKTPKEFDAAREKTLQEIDTLLERGRYESSFATMIIKAARRERQTA